MDSRGTSAGGGPGHRRRVLLVDDSAGQRRLLAAALRPMQHEIVEAASAEEALELHRARPFDFVLSDWMMPGLSGLDLCRAFRELPTAGYCYLILLTSKSGAQEVALGLQAGADDFLSKPLSTDELHARMAAGERILRMAEELSTKNRLIGSTLSELQRLYDAFERDLVEARNLQQSLVPERERDFGTGRVSLVLRPSGQIGGDLVGFFPISDRRLGLYAIDVSGHGVASAIMTARLAGVLSGAAPERNIALQPDGAGGFRARAPEDVAMALNRMMLEDLRAEQYFTMIYAEADLITGRIALVQAGHPYPLLLRPEAEAVALGDGGLPIGLIEEAGYERVEWTMRPGDQLLIVSDGMTECQDPLGEEFGDHGLARSLWRHRGRSGQDLLDALQTDLMRHADGHDLRDDVSAILFQFTGSPGAADWLEPEATGVLTLV